MSRLCGASKKHIFNLGQALSLDIKGRYWVGRHFSQSKECTTHMEFNINGVRRSISLLKVKVTQSSPTICDPMDYTIHGIHQTRILEWVVFHFSRRSSQPMNQIQDSGTEGGFFPHTVPVINIYSERLLISRLLQIKEKNVLKYFGVSLIMFIFCIFNIL